MGYLLINVSIIMSCNAKQGKDRHLEQSVKKLPCVGFESTTHCILRRYSYQLSYQSSSAVHVHVHAHVLV